MEFDLDGMVFNVRLQLWTGYMLVPTFSNPTISNEQFAVLRPLTLNLTLKFDLDENGILCAASTLDEVRFDTKILKIRQYLMDHLRFPVL